MHAEGHNSTSRLPTTDRLGVVRRCAQALLATLAMTLSSLVANSAWADFFWDFRPYRVVVWVALADGPGTSPALFDALAERLRDRAEAECGATWDLKVDRAPPAVAARWLANPEAAWETVVGETLPDADKLMLLGLADDAEGLRVTCREIDVRTRIASTVLSRAVRQRALWADESFRLVRNSFAPVVRLDRSTENTVLAHPKAWRLIVDPSSPARILPGSLLVPVTRRNNSQGQARPNDIQPIPWTILVAQRETYPGLVCDLHSGIRGPLAAKSSVRVERLAVVARPEFSTTTLTLVARGDAKTPLVGYEVLVQPPPEYVAEAEKTAPPMGAAPMPAAAAPSATPAAPTVSNVPPRSLGRTDWRGEIELPVEKTSLVMLQIKSGRESLVRLPFAPGLARQVQLPVSDDTTRLQAEGYLLGVQESIIDQIARRQVLAIRIRKQLEARKVAEAEEMMKILRTMPTAEQIGTQIDTERRKKFTVDKQKDPRMDARIERLFADTHKLLQAHLSPKLIQDLSGEIDRARGGAE